MGLSNKVLRRGYLEYISVYETFLLKPVHKSFIFKNVKFEISAGPKTFTIAKVSTKIVTSGITPEMKESTLELPIDTENHKVFIILTARTKIKDPEVARNFLIDEINKAVTILSVLISPFLFISLIYSGFHKPKISDTWVLEDKFLIQPPLSLPANLDKNITFIEEQLAKGKELGNRFELISRFYQKALLENEHLEEKFLWLWTILEIFPMHDTSNIQPLALYLSDLTKRDIKHIKTHLKIGKFHGVRSSLVHNGYLDITTVCNDVGEFMYRINDIVLEIISSLCGLPYSGNLDKYFDDDYNFNKHCQRIDLNNFNIKIDCQDTYMTSPSIPPI